MKQIIRLLILLLFCVLFRNELPAQGFAGKRFVVGYNLGVFHAFWHRTYNKDGDARNFNLFKSWNTTHYLDLDYVFNRAHVIGVSYNQFRTNDGEWDSSSPDNFHLYGRGYGVYYKLFKAKNGSIAPIGTWWKFQFTRMFYRAEEIQNPVNVENYNNYDFRLSFGSQKVLFSNVLFNIGIEATAPIRIDEWDYLARYISRIDLHNGINVKIGLSLPL